MRNLLTGFLLFITLPVAAGLQGDLRNGGKLYKHKKYGQALAQYNEILKENPSSQEAAIGAGASAYYLKDYAAAQAAFKQAAEPDNIRQMDALFNLGNAYYRANDTDKAKQAYRQAILKNPQDKDAIHNLQLVEEEQQNQQNQNNQNDKNQQNQSKNKNPQNKKDNPQDGHDDSQDSQDDSQAQQNPQNQQQPQPSQAQKDAADRVMQMAKDQETKPQPHNGAGVADDSVEKDW